MKLDTVNRQTTFIVDSIRRRLSMLLEKICFVNILDIPALSKTPQNVVNAKMTGF